MPGVFVLCLNDGYCYRTISLVVLILLVGLTSQKSSQVMAEVALYQVDVYQNEVCSDDIWFTTLEDIANECLTISPTRSSVYSCDLKMEQVFPSSDCTDEVTREQPFDVCESNVPNISYTGRCVSYPDDKVLHYVTGQSCNEEGGLTNSNTNEHLVILDKCTYLPFEVDHSFILTLANDGSGTLTLVMYEESANCAGSLSKTYTLKLGECGLVPFTFVGVYIKKDVAAQIFPVVEGISLGTSTKSPTQGSTPDQNKAGAPSTSLSILIFCTIFMAVAV